MLKQKALRKILITSLTVVILLLIYIMPSNYSSTNNLNIVPEVEYKSTSINYIYLLNDNDLLVKVNVLINDTNDILQKVNGILDKLIKNNTNPKGLISLIPESTKIIDVQLDDDYLSISFSKDILNVEDSLKEKMIEAISYSLFELKEINKISIYVEDKNISEYFGKVPSKITRNFGINKRYDITSFKNIQKVVLYYISEIDDKEYLVPITNYINNEEDKIKIIIDSLSSNYIYEPNLVSLLNSRTELINYEINDDIMLLNFNNSIFISDGTILEEVIYTISQSVFDTYDINKVVFNVENRTIKEIMK